jgi:hypothetical protein
MKSINWKIKIQYSEEPTICENVYRPEEADSNICQLFFMAFQNIYVFHISHRTPK